MSLQPIIITAYTDENFQQPVTGAQYKAMINPDSITWQRAIEYNKKQPPNTSSPSQKYKNTPSDQLNFDIVIDCTGVVNSNRTDMKSEIATLENTVFTFNGKIHRPNFVKIQWGQGFNFNGVLDSFNTSYSLFKPDGTPLRAKVSLHFSLYVAPKTVKKLDNSTSPDITHLVTVQQGMTLPQLCRNVWNDDSYYIQVARYNGLDKFRNLAGIETLIFPPIIQPA
jgi:hypothetical protein